MGNCMQGEHACTWRCAPEAEGPEAHACSVVLVQLLQPVGQEQSGDEERADRVKVPELIVRGVVVDCVHEARGVAEVAAGVAGAELADVVDVVDLREE